MKRVLPLLLAVALLTHLIGCAQPKQDANTITVWHWMTDRHDALSELAKRYETQTGVKVNLELFAPSDSYTQKIVSSAQANVLPDIFGILDTKQTFADYVKYGYVADLTQSFQANEGEWEKKLFNKAVDANRFPEGNIYGVKPGIYGVPLDVTNIQMLYNADLLQKAGIRSPPKTFAEFIDAIEALNRVGVAGLVSGWGELWMIDCFASNYAFNIMGEEKIMATYRGEVPYTDPDWIKVFNIFKILTEKKGLVQGIVTKPNKDAEQSFALERAAFAFNGSWGVNVYHEMNPKLNYGAMLPPRVNLDLPMKIWGGAGSSFVISEKSPNKPLAIAFLQWLTDTDQQAYLAEQTRNLPANQKALASISKVLAEFASVMDNTTHPTIWTYNENPLVAEKYLKGIQAIIIGQSTPQDVAKEVQAAKEKELAKEKK